MIETVPGFWWFYIAILNGWSSLSAECPSAHQSLVQPRTLILYGVFCCWSGMCVRLWVRGWEKWYNHPVFLFVCFCCLLFVCFHSITFVPSSYFPFSWNTGHFLFRHWVSFPGYITKKERAGSPALTPNQLKPVSVSIHPDKGLCYHTSVFLHQGMGGVSYCSYFHACG